MSDLAFGQIRPPALLVLSDGTTFEGEAIGALLDGTLAAQSGEVVFNTAMSGYQEIITDPSYAGQVICFTYPHIGNYGVSTADDESVRPHARGIITRAFETRPSNWRASENLEQFLSRHGIGGLTGVDTRRLTRHIREAGAMTCAFGTLSREELLSMARRERGTLGTDLVSEVTTAQPYELEGGPYRVVAYDFGIKSTILSHLRRVAHVRVVPASTPAEEVLAEDPDGIFLSNGPGDPAALPHLVAEVNELIGRRPLFGICLGHQLLGTALGASTYKLEFGHHGANHPVKRLATGRVEVTAQNHGYAIAGGTLKDAEVTHVNLNDGVIEGFVVPGESAFAVQYHPEAGPGPHDASYLFEEFAREMDRYR